MTNAERMKTAVAQRKLAKQLMAAEQKQPPPPPAAPKLRPPAAGPKPAGTPAPKPGGKPPEPAPPPEAKVVHRCGHELPVEAFRGMHCQACRNAARRKARRPRPALRDRLPDGSRFAVGYDAAAMRWTGTLTVPAPDTDAAPLVFGAAEASVFWLLTALDDRFREHLARAAGGDPSPPGATPTA